MSSCTLLNVTPGAFHEVSCPDLPHGPPHNPCRPTSFVHSANTYPLAAFLSSHVYYFPFFLWFLRPSPASLLCSPSMCWLPGLCLTMYSRAQSWSIAELFSGTKVRKGCCLGFLLLHNSSPKLVVSIMTTHDDFSPSSWAGWLSWVIVLPVLRGSIMGLHSAGHLAGAEMPRRPLSTWASMAEQLGLFHCTWLSREKKGKLLILLRPGRSQMPILWCSIDSSWQFFSIMHQLVSI